MNRICVFAHFDKHDLVDDHVFYYLRALRSINCNVVFVSTSRLSTVDECRLNPLCSKIIVRENTGYDFVSWKTGLLGIPDLDAYDEVIISNDSVYGPLYPIENMFFAMEQMDGDFWGVTENYDIAYHIQSYFVVFKRNVTRSESFLNFWKHVEAEPSKKTVISKYEVGLTQTLLAAGFKASVYAPHAPSEIEVIRHRLFSLFKKNPLPRVRKWIKYGITFDKKAINPTHFFWRKLLRDYRVPFLKIELLRENPMKTSTKGFDLFIQQHSLYPTRLIQHHLDRTKPNKLNTN